MKTVRAKYNCYIPRVEMEFFFNREVEKEMNTLFCRVPAFRWDHCWALDDYAYASLMISPERDIRFNVMLSDYFGSMQAAEVDTMAKVLFQNDFICAMPVPGPKGPIDHWQLVERPLKG